MNGDHVDFWRLPPTGQSCKVTSYMEGRFIKYLEKGNPSIILMFLHNKSVLLKNHTIRGLTKSEKRNNSKSAPVSPETKSTSLPKFQFKIKRNDL